MSYTKYLAYAILGLLCVVPFIAFVVGTGVVMPNIFNLLFPVAAFFPFITGKSFVFRILVEILVLLYVILAVKDPAYRPRASYILWAILAFVGWMAVATAMSVDPVKSFWSNFERMDGYITVIHLFALFIVAGAVLSAHKWWERFFQISIGASVLQGFGAIFQIFHFFGFAQSSQSGVRADTTFGNATYLAVYMLIHIFLTLFLVAQTFSEKNALRRSRFLLMFYGVALVLQVTALYYTETRGAILGLLGGLTIAALYIVWRAKGPEWASLRKFSWGGLIAIALLVGGFIALKDTSIVRGIPGLSRLASISLSDPTTQSRFIIWNVAYQGFQEKPILGWGQENFSYVFNKHYSPDMYNQEQWFDRAHNEFLDWLIAGGLPAFLLYVSFFLLAAWAIFRSTLSAPAQAALLGLLAGYAFNNLFVFDNLISILYFFLILALAHSFSRKELPGFMFLSKPADDKVIAVIAPIVVVVVFGGMWFLNSAGLARAQGLIDALQTQTSTGAQKDLKENFAAYEKTVSGGELGKQEAVEQLFQFASNGIAPSTSASPELKQSVYAVTHAAGVALLDARKNDARLELFMSVFLSQFGQNDEALTYLEKAASHSPDKQQILFQLGTTYLSKGEISRALETFKKAFDLAPKYNDARIMYAAGLFYAGQSAQADALLKEGFNTVLVDDNRIVQVYTNLKLHDRLIGIWKARVEKAPNDANTHIGLAAAYFSAGNNTAAIAELKRVEQLDPARAAQVEQIITQIQSGALKP